MLISKELQRKIDFAIKLIQQAEKSAKRYGEPIEVAYSGGKDSDVILELAKMAKVDFLPIYKMTTLDPSGTTKHCKENGVEIRRPRFSFLELIKKYGFPTARMRFCCGILKEYKILNVVVMGIRKCESKSRQERYKEPTECKLYNGAKKNHVECFYPILEWSDNDVAEFIEHRGIKCHPLYYGNDGVFDVTKRLGCLGCPLQGRRKRINQFLQYPNLLKIYARGGQYYLANHKQTSIHAKFADVYEWIVQNIFTYTYDEFLKKFKPQDNVFGQTNCKEFLENYFNIKF